MLSSAVLGVDVYGVCQRLAGRAPVSAVEGLTGATLQRRRPPQGAERRVLTVSVHAGRLSLRALAVIADY